MSFLFQFSQIHTGRSNINSKKPCEHWGWQHGVYLAMQLAKELAGADVPADILGRLQSMKFLAGRTNLLGAVFPVSWFQRIYFHLLSPQVGSGAASVLFKKTLHTLVAHQTLPKIARVKLTG